MFAEGIIFFRKIERPSMAISALVHNRNNFPVSIIKLFKTPHRIRKKSEKDNLKPSLIFLRKLLAIPYSDRVNLQSISTIKAEQMKRNASIRSVAEGKREI